TPVVATRVPGLRDSVRHEKTGLLVDRANSAALAQSISRLLAEPELRQRLSLEALQWADRFSWEAVAEAFADVLGAVAKREPLPAIRDFLDSS
ncbi:MAG: glycosyltransferase, partial [Myxococcota bacterium]